MWISISMLDLLFLLIWRIILSLISGKMSITATNQVSIVETDNKEGKGRVFTSIQIYLMEYMLVTSFSCEGNSSIKPNNTVSKYFWQMKKFWWWKGLFRGGLRFFPGGGGWVIINRNCWVRGVPLLIFIVEQIIYEFLKISKIKCPASLFFFIESIL